MAMYSAIPELVAALTIKDESGRMSNMELREGMILEDITFRHEGKIVTTTGKLTEIIIDTRQSKVNASLCACELKSALKDSVTIVGFVIDASGEFDSGVYFVKVSDIKSIGGALESEIPLELSETVTLQQAISTLKPGQVAVLPAMTVTEGLVVPAGVSLKGAQAGVNAAEGYRAQDNVDGETVIDAPVKLVSGESVFDGITLSGTAIPKLGDAAGGKEVVLKMKNCRVVGLDDGTGKQMNAFMAENMNTAVRFEIENCYFGNNGDKMYNLFNMHGKWKSGSYVKNCYFAKDCCRNTITIYNAEDNAVIEISDNYWESSKNGIRILGKEHMKCEVTIKNNTWADTDMPDETTGENWGGLFMVQPVAESTITQRDIFVYMSGNKNESANPQVWYYWGDLRETGKHRPQPVEDRPRIYVDGKLASYEGHEVFSVDPVQA